ncbi:DUF2911 domain-containing protein [Robiginitalea sp.]|uniref:DUF2911 domain-containing protein n=1 Tax=Robiginitalea sp. TaxID=1902411 RepID=UPI003C78FD3B
MRVFLALYLLCSAVVSNAQIVHPKASPFQEVSQDVGLSEVHIRYSRPAVKGRKIFGNLVPYGRIWRVGANESTKISLTHPMQIGDHQIPAGTYALYAFPEAAAWEIVFHKDTTLWGDGRDAYSPSDELFRTPVVPEPWPVVQENFLITFDHITHNSLEMLLIWDRTCIRIPMEVDTQSLMEASIAEALSKEPSAQSYYEAARYLQEEGRDYNRALNYIDKALEYGGDTYYFYRVRSLILEALGSYPEAIEAARRSEVLAAKEGKDEFVRMNRDNIEKWTELIKE